MWPVQWQYRALCLHQIGYLSAHRPVTNKATTQQICTIVFNQSNIFLYIVIPVPLEATIYTFERGSRLLSVFISKNLTTRNQFSYGKTLHGVDVIQRYSYPRNYQMNSQVLAPDRGSFLPPKGLGQVHLHSLQKKTKKKKCGERLVTTGNEQGINFECLREVRLWASALSEGVKTEMAEYRWRVRDVIWAIDQCRCEIMT